MAEASEVKWRVQYIRVLPPSYEASGPWNTIVESSEQQTADEAGPCREIRQVLATKYPNASERSFDVLSCEPLMEGEGEKHD